MSKTKPKVFIPNVGFHDMSAATRFGEFVPITEGRINIENMDRLEGEIQQGLADASEDDYVLLSGSHVANVLAVGFLYRKLGKVQILIWDPLIQDYRVHASSFEDLVARRDAIIQKSKEK